MQQASTSTKAAKVGSQGHAARRNGVGNGNDLAANGVPANGVAATGNGVAATGNGNGVATNGHRARGTVRWFSEPKGYGFIRPADGGDDVFVRYSSIRCDGFRALEEGQQVSFRVSRDEHGPVAVDVEVAGLATAAQPATTARTEPASVVT